MKLIIVDDNGKTLYECGDAIAKPAAPRIVRYKATLSDIVWGIFNRDKIGML